MKKSFITVISLLLIFSRFGESKILKHSVAADFYCFSADRKLIHLYSERFKNSIVILNFFADWCLPCKEEIPSLVRLYQKYKRKNVVFIGVLVKSKKIYSKEIKKFIKYYGISYPVIEANNDMIKKYGGVSVVPTTFVINHKKYISNRIIGKIDENKLSEEIDKLIKIRKSSINKK